MAASSPPGPTGDRGGRRIPAVHAGDQPRDGEPHATVPRGRGRRPATRVLHRAGFTRVYSLARRSALVSPRIAGCAVQYARSPPPKARGRSSVASPDPTPTTE